MRAKLPAGGAIDCEYDQLGRQVKLRASDGYQPLTSMMTTETSASSPPGYEKVLATTRLAGWRAEAYRFWASRSATL